MRYNRLNSKPSACLICGVPLSPAQMAKNHSLCDQQQCHWRYALLQRQHKVCVVCGCLLSERELPTQVCADSACQRDAVADLARQVYERNEARSAALLKQEIEQARQLRERVLDTFDFREPESFPLVVIPAFTAKITNLPEQRRRNFRDFLTSLISQAVVSMPEIPPKKETVTQSNQVTTVLARACACCKGSCCRDGRDHAYLKVETVQRYMAAYPDRRPRDVLADYLARVGNKTYQGSCIFHRPDGCALSREMRSDTCNQHFCKALLEFQKNPPATEPIRAFLVAANDGETHAAVVVNADIALDFSSFKLIK